MTAIHQRKQHDALSTPPSLKRFEGSSHGASREDHVIHKNHLPPLDRVRQSG